MDFLDPGNLFWLSLSLYLLAALAALFLLKKPALVTAVAQSISMLAAAAGLVSSLLFLLAGSERRVLLSVTTTVPNVSIDIRLDALSAFFLAGLSILVFCVSLYSLSFMKRRAGQSKAGLFNFLYATFVFSMLLVFTSANMVIFLIAWEAMSILSYFLVVFNSEYEENLRAGTLYLIMTTIGTAFMLTAFLLIFSYTGTLSLADVNVAEAIPTGAKNVLFVLFLLGFGIKSGIVPLHIWLPAAYPAAPDNITPLMSGVMSKTAIYGLLRFVLDFLGADQAWWGIALIVLGTASVLGGAAYAYVDDDFKRLLAFSSIENIGIIMIGLGTGLLALAYGQAAVGSVALAAALFHAFNHTIFKGGLFLGAGSVQAATRSRNFNDLGGLIRKMPVTAVLVLGGALAAAAMVPFNGFASEWLTLQAMFRSFGVGGPGSDLILMLAVAGMGLAGAVAAATYLKMFSVAFLGKPRSEMAEKASEVPGPMLVGQGILVVLGLVFGLVPALIVLLAGPVVKDLTGQPLGGLINGWFGLGNGAAAAVGSAAEISPLLVLLALTVLVIAILILVRLVGGKYIERRYGTWDCGFEALNARMQYSSAGFAKPLKIVFRILFRPSRSLKTTGRLPYHPERLEYSVSSESLIEKYLYDPLARFVHNLSLKARSTIQTGSIRRYLAYLLIALLAVMLYNLLYRGVI